MMQIRKTVIIKETIATDEMGRPCPPSCNSGWNTNANAQLWCGAS